MHSMNFDIEQQQNAPSRLLTLIDGIIRISLHIAPQSQNKALSAILNGLMGIVTYWFEYILSTLQCWRNHRADAEQRLNDALHRMRKRKHRDKRSDEPISDRSHQPKPQQKPVNEYLGLFRHRWQ